MIQLNINGNVLSDNEEILSLRDSFALQQCVLLQQLIEPQLLNNLLQQLSSVRFVTKLEMNDDNEFGKVLFVPLTDPSLFVFHFLLNNRKLFHIIQTITGCEMIGNFLGRIHRSEPDSDHHISWHGDNADNRLIGITINLSSEDYSGGLFQLRETESKNILCEIGQTQPGDAFIFRISPNLQHRLTTVKGKGNRTVGVGWFRSKPDWETFSKNYFCP